MSEHQDPPSSASTLSHGAPLAVSRDRATEAFEPTYALLDPEALDLNDFDEGFETGAEDFIFEPSAWDDELLAEGELEDLFQPPPDAPGPPPELSELFKEPQSGLGESPEPPAQTYPVDVPINPRRNTLSPRSLSEHPIFNTHDHPIDEAAEGIEVRPVEFFTSGRPPEAKPSPTALQRELSPRPQQPTAGEEHASAQIQAPDDAQLKEPSEIPLEVIERELTRSLNDLKREAQERSARRAARRARRAAQEQRIHSELESHEEPASSAVDRRTLDETLSSHDSDLPVEPELEPDSGPAPALDPEEELSELYILKEATPQAQLPPRAPSAPSSAPKTEQRSKARAKSVAFMGSQGGVGLSMIVANLGAALARMGFKVALADFNPSGTNLHTYLGLEPSITTPSELLRRSPDPQVERVPLHEAGSEERSLWLCRPAGALLSSTPVEHRMRAFQALKKIDAEIVLMDLGHEMDQFSLERCREASKGVVVFRPSTVSIERGHGLLRAALFSALIAQGDDASIVARALLMADHVGQLNTPSSLLTALERVNPQAATLMRDRLTSFQPQLLMNQCKTHADRDLTLDLCAILQRKWRIGASPLGAIDYDEATGQAVRQRIIEPLILSHSGSSICSELERFAKRFARDLFKVEPT